MGSVKNPDLAIHHHRHATAFSLADLCTQFLKHGFNDPNFVYVVPLDESMVVFETFWIVSSVSETANLPKMFQNDIKILSPNFIKQIPNFNYVFILFFVERQPAHCLSLT